MYSFPLFWRIFGAYAALGVIAACVLAGVLTSRERNIVVSQIQQRSHDAASLLASRAAEAIQSGPAPQLQAELKRLSAENGMRFTLVAGDGTVIADSHDDPTLMDNHRSREELVQARHQGTGVSRRFSPTLNLPMLYYALRLGDEHAPLGFVRVATTVESAETQVAAVRRLIWTTFAFAGALAIVATFLIAGWIVRPVHRLTETAQAVARGELSRTFHLPRRDEFGRLAEAFNSMSGELSRRIDELQHQQQTLQENSELLETVLGSMIEGVVVVDSHEQVLFANGAARKLFDLETPNAVGRPIWEASRHRAIHDVIRSGLAGKSPLQSEFEFPRTKSVISVTASRLPGKPCPGVVLVLHDVTELRRLENVRQEFVSSVSHELKTPLTSIQAYTETLLHGAIDDPAHNRQFLQRIEEQSERLHALILDLLSLARIESEQDAFEVLPVSVGDVIGACVDEHRTKADAKGLSLESQAPAWDVRVLADAEGLRTMLDNLVDNAINYTPAGGKVSVSCESANGMAAIVVADTGVGISPEHQARIFERFYRVDKARSRELGGTGLGLSIVKHLTQVFGGTIGVESQPGKGTVFTVRLPLAKAAGQS